jgi:CubicO group peptidase (beta-lactamase class C family)
MSWLIDRSTNYSNVTWTTPISKLLPDDFVLSDPWATQHITIEDALSHRTGYPRHDFALAETAKGTIRSLRNLPMSAEPRAKYQYSNTMFAAVGYLISVLSKVPLPEFFKKNIWLPMGMNNTFLTLSDAKASGINLAKSYFYNNDTKSYVEVPYTEIPGQEGAGMIISNVADYIKYLRVLINGGSPFSPKGRTDILSPHMLSSNSITDVWFTGAHSYGFGWGVYVTQGETYFEHNGAIGDFVAIMAIIPKKKFGVVVFQNSATDAHDILLRRIVDDYFQVPHRERIDFEGR